MKLENGDAVTMSVKQDTYGLMWHVMIEREKDGMVAYTTCGKKPTKDSKVVQTLLKHLSV